MDKPRLDKMQAVLALMNATRDQCMLLDRDGYIQFINKTNREISLDLKVQDYPDATITRVGEEDIKVEANGRIDGVFFIEMAREDIVQMKTAIQVELISDGEVMDEISTNFVGPVSKR